MPIRRSRTSRWQIADSGRMAISGQSYMATGGQNPMSANTDRGRLVAPRGQRSPKVHIDPGVVAAVISGRPELSDEQAVMVQAACAPDLAVTPIAGRPGAGKTYATDPRSGFYVWWTLVG